MSKVIIRQMLLLTIAGIAVLMDLYEMRIKNSWIICSFIAGLIYSIWSGNRHGVVQFVLGTAVPIVLLGWLFYFRMLGTGDIKLFCVLGGLMGPYHILWCMWYAVLAGAVLSLAILFFCGGFHQRFHYLEQYIRQLIETGKQSPYYRTGIAFENIHFTIPIFMSVMLYTGGIY